jgi:glycosyltransferase involved in cell wall biosynthesis
MRTETRWSISACFPAYNESANLPTVVRATDEVLRAVADAYEIIVVDDGSTDETPDVLRTLAATYPRLRSLRHSTNAGYGAAVLTGLRAAQLDLVFFCDADNQFDVRELPKLLALIDDADLVTGYRGTRRDPAHRRLNALLWGGLVRVAFGVTVRDLNCAFKLMRRRTLERAGLHDMAATGAALNAELLARLGRIDARIREVEVSHHPRVHGQQTGASPKVILRAFKEAAALYWRLRRAR